MGRYGRNPIGTCDGPDTRRSANSDADAGTIRGSIEEVDGGGLAIAEDFREPFDEQMQDGRRAFLEVDGHGSREGLDFRGFEPPSNHPVQSMKSLGGVVMSSTRHLSQL